MWATTTCPNDDDSTLRGPGAVRIRFTMRPEERSTTATWDSRSAVTSATGSPPLAPARTRLGFTAAARATARSSRLFTLRIREWPGTRSLAPATPPGHNARGTYPATGDVSPAWTSRGLVVVWSCGGG